jgi:hypothetical protein
VTVVSNLRIRYLIGLGLAVVLPFSSLQEVRARDLAPRAYLITSLHSNAVLTGALTNCHCDNALSWTGRNDGSAGEEAFR